MVWMANSQSHAAIRRSCFVVAESRLSDSTAPCRLDTWDRAEAVQQIASILAAVYLRLRFPAPALSPELDSPETERVHVTGG